VLVEHELADVDAGDPSLHAACKDCASGVVEIPFRGRF
jgi:hypothetical protein